MSAQQQAVEAGVAQAWLDAGSQAGVQVAHGSQIDGSQNPPQADGSQNLQSDGSQAEPKS
jgi:hypothetical protein